MAVRATSKIIGMRSAKRHWGDVKNIKSGNCSHISIEKTEKLLMIYKKSRLKKAKVHHNELANKNDACAAWGDEDEKFNLGLKKFGVDVDALKIPAV